MTTLKIRACRICGRGSLRTSLPRGRPTHGQHRKVVCTAEGLRRSRLWNIHGKETTTPCRSHRRLFASMTSERRTEDQTAAVSILEHREELLGSIPLEDVRNFCFIAHVDHGKSSLTSRILELAGNLGSKAQQTALEAAFSGSSAPDINDMKSDVESSIGLNDEVVSNHDKERIELLDTLSVERERGITVKASAASLLYRHPSAAVGPTGCLLLNVVDTPGHVDFGLEVSRSLGAVEGAVLLFDASKGIQAQSLSVHAKAEALGVTLLPALTKVDMDTARPVDVTLAVSDLFGFDPDFILETSARQRIGIRAVLDAVCEKIPPPKALPDDHSRVLRSRVIDSWFEPQRGVVCLIQVLSGQLSEGDRITVLDPSKTLGSEEPVTVSSTRVDHHSIQEIGLVTPHRIRTGSLSRGQMGYVIAGLRDPRQAQSGTLLVLHNDLPVVEKMFLPVPPPLSLGAPASIGGGGHASTSALRSVLYASVHPMEGDGFDELSSAVDRLALNDTGLEVTRTSGMSNSASGGPFLGPGLRVGFQGLLHMEVFRQRLMDEFGLDAIVTPPKVPYLVTYLGRKGSQDSQREPEEVVVEDLTEWPVSEERFVVKEPVVNVRIMAPVEHAGNVMELIARKRGTGMETKQVDDNTWFFHAQIPWAEIVTDFHDDLKTTTAGFGSFDTFEADPPYQQAALAKVEILLNGDVVEPLAFVCHKDAAQSQGRGVCQKLQKVLPRKQFVTVIQAKAEGRIIASERIRAYRKDVLTTGGSKSVGGGDASRKKKLLEKQKKGKKRQQASGKVTLSQAAFNSVITRSK